MNNLKTAALLAFLSALVWGVAYAWGGMDGFWVGLVLVGFMNFAAYFWSDKIALAATRARPVAEHQLPNVYSIVRNLTSRAGMPMPRIYLIDSPQPNAFATGRNPQNAAVAVTTAAAQDVAGATLAVMITAATRATAATTVTTMTMGAAQAMAASTVVVATTRATVPAVVVAVIAAVRTAPAMAA